MLAHECCVLVNARRLMMMMMMVFITAPAVHNVVGAKEVKADDRKDDLQTNESLLLMFTEKLVNSGVPDEGGAKEIPGIGTMRYSVTNSTITSFDQSTSNVYQSITDGSAGGMVGGSAGGEVDGSAGRVIGGSVWTMTGGVMKIEGKWQYSVDWALGSMGDHGVYTATAVGVSINVSNWNDRDVTSSECICTIEDVSLIFAGGASWLYNKFVSYTKGSIREDRHLEVKLCRLARQTVRDFFFRGDKSDVVSKDEESIPTDQIEDDSNVDRGSSVISRERKLGSGIHGRNTSEEFLEDSSVPAQFATPEVPEVPRGSLDHPTHVTPPSVYSDVPAVAAAALKIDTSNQNNSSTSHNSSLFLVLMVIVLAKLSSLTAA